MAKRARVGVTMIAATAGAVAVISCSQAGTAGPAVPTAFLAPTGSDSSSCTQGAPCASFNRAYLVAKCGDTVEVAAGTYGAQEISADSSKNNCSGDVVFRPAAGASVLVSAPTGIALHFSSSRHIEIRGMTFTGIPGVYVGDNSSSGAGLTKYITLRNNSINYLIARSPDTLSIIGGDIGGTIGPGGSPVSCAYVCATTFVVNGGVGENQIGRAYGSTINASDVLIDGVLWHDAYRQVGPEIHLACLWVANLVGFTVRNSRFTHCDSETVHFNGWVKRSLWENNFIEHASNTAGTGPGSAPLQFNISANSGSLDDVVWRNNTIEGTISGTENGAQIPSSNFWWIGNIITGSTYSSCLTGPQGFEAVNWRYNIFSATAPRCGDGDTTAATFGFVSGSDLHLTASSPALGFVPPSAYGLPTSFSAPGGETVNSVLTTDYDGELRPLTGPNNDAGADERTSSAARASDALRVTVNRWSRKISTDVHSVSLAARRLHARRLTHSALRVRRDALRACKAIAAHHPSAVKGRRARKLALTGFANYAAAGSHWAASGRERLKGHKSAAARFERKGAVYAKAGNRLLVSAGKLLR